MPLPPSPPTCPGNQQLLVMMQQQQQQMQQMQQQHQQMQLQLHQLHQLVTAMQGDLSAHGHQIGQVQGVSSLLVAFKEDADKHGMHVTDRLDHVWEQLHSPHAAVLCNVPEDERDVRAAARPGDQQPRNAVTRALSSAGVRASDIISCMRLGTSGRGQRNAPIKVVFGSAAAKQRAMRHGGRNGIWVKPYITAVVQRLRKAKHGPHIAHLLRLGVNFHWKRKFDLHVVWPNGSREQWRDDMLLLQEVPVHRRISDEPTSDDGGTHADAARSAAVGTAPRAAAAALAARAAGGGGGSGSRSGGGRGR